MCRSYLLAYADAVLLHEQDDDPISYHNDNKTTMDVWIDYDRVDLTVLDGKGHQKKFNGYRTTTIREVKDALRDGGWTFIDESTSLALKSDGDALEVTVVCARTSRVPCIDDALLCDTGFFRA